MDRHQQHVNGVYKKYILTKVTNGFEIEKSFVIKLIRCQKKNFEVYRYGSVGLSGRAV